MIVDDWTEEQGRDAEELGQQDTDKVRKKYKECGCCD